MHDLVGQTIDFNGRGVGEVLEYDKRKVSRGHTVKWEVGPATKLVSKLNPYEYLNVAAA
jgi:hypothetical protein